MRQTIDDRDIVINQGGGRRGLPLGSGRAIAVAICAVAVLVGLWLLIQTLDPQARAAREAAQWRQAALDSQLQGVDLLGSALLRLALPLALALGVLGLVLVGLRLIYIRWASVASVAAHYHVQALEAQRAFVPQTLTYSPQYSNRQDIDAPLPLLGEHTPALALPVPTFAQLLDQGKVGKGTPLMLGTDIETGAPLLGSWLDLYSTAIGGLPGTGKTTSQRFLACQTALHGAGFVIVDPHAGAGEDSLAETLSPLRAAFLCEPASSDQGILQAVQLVADIGQRRVKGDRDRRPIILWLDETTALLGRSSIAGPLADLIEAIAQEYRKVGVFCAASGQIWTASRTGDNSALRDSFASVLAHRMKRSQARLLLPTDEAERVERLETGQAVLWRTSGATNVIQVPNTTGADVVNVAKLLASGRSPVEPRGRLLDASGTPERKSDGSLMEVSAVLDSTAAASGSAPSALDARILALFVAGNDAAEIVRELWPEIKQGRATQEKSMVVQATIRRAVGQGNA